MDRTLLLTQSETILLSSVPNKIPPFLHRSYSYGFAFPNTQDFFCLGQDNNFCEPTRTDTLIQQTNQPIMDIKAVSDQNKGRDKKCVTQAAVWLLQSAVTNCNKWWFSQVREKCTKGGGQGA